MRLFAGTSGFSYKQWKGPFYPEDLPQKDWLAYYASRLPAVEINNTFYRLPRAGVMEDWAAAVPAGFRFVIKASQRITHRARLRDCEELLGVLTQATDPLGPARGPFLFQLPPNFKKDVERLVAFLGALDANVCAAFEFRHASWDDEEVRAVLRDAGAALVTVDDDGPESSPVAVDADPPPLPATADFGYLRLRRTEYSDADLDAWATRLHETAWNEAHVFFKHEDGGVGPAWAHALQGRVRTDS